MGVATQAEPPLPALARLRRFDRLARPLPVGLPPRCTLVVGQSLPSHAGTSDVGPRPSRSRRPPSGTRTRATIRRRAAARRRKRVISHARRLTPVYTAPGILLRQPVQREGALLDNQSRRKHGRGRSARGRPVLARRHRGRRRRGVRAGVAADATIGEGVRDRRGRHRPARHRHAAPRGRSRRSRPESPLESRAHRRAGDDHDTAHSQVRARRACRFLRRLDRRRRGLPGSRRGGPYQRRRPDRARCLPRDGGDVSRARPAGRRRAADRARPIAGDDLGPVPALLGHLFKLLSPSSPVSCCC